MAACRRSFAPMSSRWATLRCIWTVRRAIFCPTAAAGSGATGARDILPDAGALGCEGQREWRDNAITLSSLSTGFDKLEYGTMRVSTPRLTLEQPIRWLRDAEHPRLTGALSLDAAKTTFSGGSYLPASTLKFALDGRDPTWFQFTGALHAEAIGPVRLSGRWDGERLRGRGGQNSR